jgi:hypothetical protein
MLVLLLISLVAVGCGGGAACFLDGWCPVVIDTEVEADGSSGAFTASGAFCSEGTIDSESATTSSPNSEPPSPDFTDGTYFFESEMVCADGSGSISLETKVYPLPESGSDQPEREGEWFLHSGTGDYSGGGSGEYRISFDEPCCSETYTGTIESANP